MSGRLYARILLTSTAQYEMQVMFTFIHVTVVLQQQYCTYIEVGCIHLNVGLLHSFYVYICKPTGKYLLIIFFSRNVASVSILRILLCACGKNKTIDYIFRILFTFSNVQRKVHADSTIVHEYRLDYKRDIKDCTFLKIPKDM